MSKKPNVLFLFSDQHKASVLGCENHPDVYTPNLDELAENGVRFSRAYSQNAICVPSRCSLFSGLYPRTLGCYNNSDRTNIMNNVMSLQKLFHDNGYITAAFGKRHLYGSIDDGWDIHSSHLAHESPDNSYVEWINKEGYAQEFANDWAAEFSCPPPNSDASTSLPFSLLASRLSHLPNTHTMEAYTAKLTNDFIKQHKNCHKPYFVFSSFYRPHQPYTPLPEYASKYESKSWGNGKRYGDNIKRPETLSQDYHSLPPFLQMQCEGDNRVWRMDKARENEQLYRTYISYYYALVEEIDYHIGTILETLKNYGDIDNTIIIYTSDHGDFVGSHGMVEKAAEGHNIYEDTLRVPLMFSWKNNMVKKHYKQRTCRFN